MITAAAAVGLADGSASDATAAGAGAVSDGVPVMVSTAITATGVAAPGNSAPDVATDFAGRVSIVRGAVTSAAEYGAATGAAASGTPGDGRDAATPWKWATALLTGPTTPGDVSIGTASLETVSGAGSVAAVGGLPVMGVLLDTPSSRRLFAGGDLTSVSQCGAEMILGGGPVWNAPIKRLVRASITLAISEYTLPSA